jgi:outer membrane protein OmpA-like peptidoglycan-associated protein
VPFDQVMDFSVIEKLGKEPKYRNQKDEYKIQLAPKGVSQVRAESDEILTNTIVIQFFPNSWDLHKKINKDENGQVTEVLYDPNVDTVLEEVAKLAGQFGNARIIVEGHTDSSRRGQIPEAMVKELSQNRANAVRQALVNSHQMDPNRFAAAGMGWDVPADPSDPENQAKNRRVEIKVYSAEKQ